MPARPRWCCSTWRAASPCWWAARSYGESQFNRALRARRQPGSAFKPFIYLAALESGLTPDSMVQGPAHHPQGLEPAQRSTAAIRGAVTLREALARSHQHGRGAPPMTHGPRKTAETAHRLGIASELRPDATLALGTSEVTLLELTGAYGAFASGGRRDRAAHRQARAHGSGRVLYQRPARRPPGSWWPPQHAGALNDMLNAALIFGTGKRAALPLHPACGKTGTTQEFRDAWFVGYTAHLVGGVWVGNDDRRPMNRVMGGNLPARLWHEVMLLAHERPHADGAARHRADRAAGARRTEGRSGHGAAAADGPCVSRARAGAVGRSRRSPSVLIAVS